MLPGPTVRLDVPQENGQTRDPAVVTPGAGGGDMTGGTGAGKGGRVVSNGLGAAAAQAERSETGVPVAVQNGVVDPTGPGNGAFLREMAASAHPDRGYGPALTQRTCPRSSSDRCRLAPSRR